VTFAKLAAPDALLKRRKKVAEVVAVARPSGRISPLRC
jgi:hypothetical protein